MKSLKILKEIAKDYHFALDNKDNPLRKGKFSMNGKINGHFLKITQRFLMLGSADGGSDVFPFTLIDIHLKPYVPNVLIKRKVFFLPLFADSDYIQINQSFKKYKKLSNNKLFLRTDSENLKYYLNVIDKNLDLLTSILSKGFLSGAVIVDGNILRLIKGSFNISRDYEDFKNILNRLVDLAEVLESSIS